MARIRLRRIARGEGVNAMKKLFCATLAALALSTASAAAEPVVLDTEAQLDVLAASADIWRADFADFGTMSIVPDYVRRFSPGETDFAVTDLDDNGRLELLVRHASSLREPHPSFLNRMPTRVGMAIYEIDENGALARIALDTSDDAPDLRKLSGVHDITDRGSRRYHLATQILSKGDSFDYQMRYTRFEITNGRVYNWLRAKESGTFEIHEDTVTATNARTATIYDGKPDHRNMTGEAFRETDFYKDFFRTIPPLGSIHWVKGEKLMPNPRTELAASWHGFSYAAVDGPRG